MALAGNIPPLPLPIITTVVAPQAQAVTQSLRDIQRCGDRPITINHQWQFNGTNIDNAGDSLTPLLRSHAQDAGSFQHGTNSLGSATSANAVLTVNSPLLITVQPQSSSQQLSTRHFLSVAASGTVPLNYQWRFHCTNISNATDSSYIFASAQTSAAGSYLVVADKYRGHRHQR